MANADPSRPSGPPGWVCVLYGLLVAVVCVDFFIRRGVFWTLVLIAASAVLTVPIRRMVRRT